ncbi:DgyrCDS3115 [Dimorphilus gyrociliatus]|uniref:DgyrCDS3115 n=1 Tax=Dimorphilus gyrociliatus TaxID=2664684 RepID=A0A7I8VE46_9ANNE|nr:DgyrCDS3115 [Dimorphilus gyrociliatus]
MTAFRNQKYKDLKKKHLASGELFVDSEFPPNNKSLFFSQVDNSIEWRRPKELSKIPRLLVENSTSDDYVEGPTGAGWFGSTCCALLSDKKLLFKVLPDYKKQEFTDESQYAGIFKFSFWSVGEWFEVVVDDSLPVKDNKLIYLHTEAKNEYWGALCQKAYAKFIGDYESMNMTNASNALVDFTGGVAQPISFEDYDLLSTEVRQEIFKMLFEASQNKSLMIVRKQCSAEEKLTTSSDGLYNGLNYFVSSVLGPNLESKVKDYLGKNKLGLIRVRNPLGNKEWNGKWNEQSEPMKQLSPKEKQKNGILYSNDSEFWMDFDEFLDKFTNVDICHFLNTSFFSAGKSLNETAFKGEWSIGAAGTKKDRSGGNETQKTFLNNPQYLFEISNVKDDVIISLETSGKDMNERAIGLHIMRVADNQKYRINDKGETVFKTTFNKLRSAYVKETFKRGCYILIPCTEAAGFAGEFYLRLYSSAKLNAKSMNDIVPTKATCCSKPYNFITRLRIKQVENMDLPDMTKARMDNFMTNLLIKSEKEKFESIPVKAKENSGKLDAEYDTRCIFYRKKFTEPIIIQVFEYGRIRSNIVAEGQIEGRDIKEEIQEKSLELISGEKQGFKKIPGNLVVEFSGSDDITAY